jgi:hypothetical protein
MHIPRGILPFATPLAFNFTRVSGRILSSGRSRKQLALSNELAIGDSRNEYRKSRRVGSA